MISYAEVSCNHWAIASHLFSFLFSWWSFCGPGQYRRKGDSRCQEMRVFSTIFLFPLFFSQYGSGLYLYESDRVGTFNGESYGKVYIRDNKVDVQTYVSLILFLPKFYAYFVGYARCLRAPRSSDGGLKGLLDHACFPKRLNRSLQ